MLFAFFIFTNWHDNVINIAGLFGLVVLAGKFYALAKNKNRGLFYAGLVGFVLVVLNNILYHSGNLYWLPVVQIVTFAFFLGWITAISIQLYNGNLNRTKEMRN